MPTGRLKEIDLIINELKLHWIEQPHLRLGQLIENIVNLDGRDIFYLDDNELKIALQNYGEMGSQ